MVASCCAYNCTNCANKNGISFYRFPLNDKERLTQWIAATRRKNFVPTTHTLLCSEHFTSKCFLQNYVNTKRLKSDAVPTIFDFSDHLTIWTNIEERMTSSSNKKVLNGCEPNKRQRLQGAALEDSIDTANMLVPNPPIPVTSVQSSFSSIIPDSINVGERTLIPAAASNLILELLDEDDCSEKERDFILPDSNEALRNAQDDVPMMGPTPKTSRAELQDTVLPTSPTPQLLSLPNSVLHCSSKRSFLVDSNDGTNRKFIISQLSDCKPKTSDHVNQPMTVNNNVMKVIRIPGESEKKSSQIISQPHASSSTYDLVNSSKRSNTPILPMYTKKEISLDDDTVSDASYSTEDLSEMSGNPCSCCKLVLGKLQHLQSQLEHNTMLLNQLIEANNTSSNDIGQPVCLPISCFQPKEWLPISYVEDLKPFDEYLSDESSFVQYSLHLSTFGGNNIKDATRRILHQIIDHNISLQLNWKGRGLKHAFQTYANVINLVHRSVIRVPKCGAATLAEIENEIKAWFRFAPDRYGGRSKRFSARTPAFTSV